MSDYLPPETTRSLTKEMKKNMPGYLPLEVITQIISRLPAESAVRCTAVCKAWYALIKDPSFISTHLQQAASSLQDDLLLLSYPGGDGRPHLRTVYDLRRDNDAFEEYKKFPLPSKPEVDHCFSFGTCNGLICLSDVKKGDWNIILWNPSIHKHFILPEPDLDLPGDSYYCHNYSTIGFGFDSVSNDYKVLIIVPSDGDANDLGEVPSDGDASDLGEVPSDGDANDLGEVWLFSLNRCSWTRLTDVSPKHGHAFERMVFVKGALHYGHYLHMILAFNISTETFFVINIPKAVVQSAPERDMSLIEYEDSIALVNQGNNDVIKHELWVMKEHGVDSSWMKVFHSIDENGGLVFGTYVFDVLGARKTGELLLNVDSEQGNGCELAMLDLNCHKQEHQKQQPLKSIGVRTIGVIETIRYLLFGRYVESLVLLDKGEEDIAAEAV